MTFTHKQLTTTLGVAAVLLLAVIVGMSFYFATQMNVRDNLIVTQGEEVTELQNEVSEVEEQIVAEQKFSANCASQSEAYALAAYYNNEANLHLLDAMANLTGPEYLFNEYLADYEASVDLYISALDDAESIPCA